MEQPDSPDAGKASAKNEAIAGIYRAKRAIEGADVASVESPSGRKDVEVAYQASYGFEVEQGQAVGVYFEPDRATPEVVHIDWADGRDRSSIDWGDVQTFEESDYYTEDE
jgi:hypothetical protein